MMEVQFTEAQMTCGDWLSLKLEKGSVSTARRFLFGRVEGRYSAELKPYRARRSLDANAYFWTLCGALAAATGIPKNEIYREYVREIGENFDIVPVRDDAAEHWKKNWEARGVGWLCESLGPSKLVGYTNFACYYGSSTYNTAQMSRLIDLVVFDCKEQGIETMTPDELQKMKARWKDAPDDKSL